VTASAGWSANGIETQPRWRQLLKSAFGQKAKNIYIRVFAVILFSLGALLTFSPHVFEFFSSFTKEPALLPVTLLVPYVYLIFEMVLSRLEEDDDSTEQKRLYEARRTEVLERCFERKMSVDAFKRSMAGLRNWGKDGAKAVVDWIAADRSGVIKVQILAYSSETLLDGIIDVAQRIKDNIAGGIPAPQNIVFELLTRDLGGKWRLPCLASHEADEDYRRGLNARFGQYLSRWRTEFYRAFDFFPRDRLVLEARWYPFEPTYKAVIVNKKIGVVGIYDVHGVNHRGVDGWDYHGQGVSMYEVQATGSVANSRLALESITRLFDELWNQHSMSADIF
jgi:hypothetical protein